MIVTVTNLLIIVPRKCTTCFNPLIVHWSWSISNFSIQQGSVLSPINRTFQVHTITLNSYTYTPRASAWKRLRGVSLNNLGIDLCALLKNGTTECLSTTNHLILEPKRFRVSVSPALPGLVLHVSVPFEQQQVPTTRIRLAFFWHLWQLCGNVRCSTIKPLWTSFIPTLLVPTYSLVRPIWISKTGRVLIRSSVESVHSYIICVRLSDTPMSSTPHTWFPISDHKFL